jgi:oligopeptidase B
MILRILAVLIVLSASFAEAQTVRQQAPKAARIPHIDTTFNDIRLDNYHWMRSKGSSEVINHLYAENGFADKYMRNSSILMKKIYEEVRGRMIDDVQSLPSRSKKQLYYTRYEKGKDYPKYFRKADSLNAKEILLLDLDSLSKQYMYFNVSAISISASGNRMLYGIDSKGDRLFNVYFKDIVSGQNLGDTINQVNSICWVGEDEVIYTLPEKKTQRSYIAYRHKLGTSASEDIKVDEELDPTFQLSFSRSTSERFIIKVASQTLSTEVSFLDLENPTKGFQLVEKRRRNHNYSIDHVEGNIFIIGSDDNAPNGQVFTASIDNPSQKNWKILLPERKDVLLVDYKIQGDLLILNEQFDAQRQLVLQNLKTGRRDTIHVSDEPVSIGFTSYFEHDEDSLRISFGSIRKQSEVWDIDLKTRKLKFIYRDSIRGGYDPNMYVSERIYAKSADGASIPLTIIYKKGLKMDGSNPVWMSAYGSYGNPSLPGFSMANISLLDRGFVCATAHVRGGNDCGRSWYDDGKLLKKKNTFQDLIACAEKLIEDKYSSKGKILIQGGSAGGLLVGAVLNMRPDLFGCAIANVPFVDVINTMLDASLPLTTFEYDEWGNPNIKVYYDYMKSYAPYENVSAQNYPTILATAGYNDSQVPYWEPAKWVAKLREIKTDSNTILLKTNMDAGHGGASGRFGRLKDLAFEYAFGMQALGFEENYLVVKGTTKDSQGNVLPFVNVHIEGTTIGTASNENGQFSLEIQKDQSAVFVFSSIGFKKKVIPITIQTNIDDLNASLEPENYQIRTFELKADAKDPAYAVMKKAIEKRKQHLNEVPAYSSDIYIKGAVRLDEIPKKLPFFISKDNMPDSTDLGLVYLSESVARYHEKRPEDVKEEMIASKIAGMKQGFSWNRVSDILMNFYENLVNLTYYSSRGFVSPVSESAMFYYKYRMIGTFSDNGHTINRIALEPKRKNDPCFRGEIFIVDDTWNIHSLDLILTKDAQIEYVDTLYIRQEYLPVEDSLWLPQSMQLTSHIKVFGFAATDNSVGVFSNYKINPPFPKNFFGNEIFRVEDKANKKDTVYWKDTRPMTLTKEEEANYRKADSVEVVQSSEVYLDSVDRRTNRFGLGKLLLTGLTRTNSFDKEYWRINPLITAVSFNAVEGLTLNPEVTYTKRQEDSRFYIVKGNLRYGFADTRWKGSASFFKLTNPKNFNYWFIEGGRMMGQVNTNDPISPLINAAYSLIDNRNLIRLVERTGIDAVWNRELVNGLMFQMNASFFDRRMPQNNTNFTYSSKGLDYASNQDLYSVSADGSTFKSQIATIGFKANYRINQKYETRGNRKIIRGSKWPRLGIEVNQAIAGLAGSDVKYTHLEASVYDAVELGLIGKTTYKVSVGTFLGKSNMSFIDNRHFNGNETFLLRNFSSNMPYDFFYSSFNRFNALGYYSSSTNQPYFEGHIEHNFYNWLTNKLPLIRKAKFGTVAGANLIWVESNPLYTEFYVGLDNILKILRVDFVSQYTPGQALKPLIRFGLKL